MPQDIQKVAFRVNGKQVNIQNPDPSLLLVDFFRENLYLTGPKKPCGEGGCGGCTSVMAKPKDWNDSSSPEFLSFNSCLRRVVQCEGNEIFTTEYFAQMDNPIFDAKKFHKIQEDIPKTIAYNNGSQCGYCTSGFVSNLAAYCANTCKEKRDIVDIENLFDGNLCRCTGFRPILYGAKTLAHDGNQDEAKNTPVLVTSDLTYFNGGIESKNATVVPSKQKHKKRIHLSLENSQNDITIISEDISTSYSGSPPLLNYKETNKAPQVKRNIEKLEEQIKIISGEVSTWYSGFTTVESLLSYCTKIPQEERNFAAVKYVGANSSHGIYKQKNGYNPKYLFDMSGINSMRQCSMQGGKLKIGGGCSITMLFNELRSIQRKYGDSKNVEVIQKAADNIERVASTIIRNVCSIGGNLAMVVIFGFASDLVNSVYVLESVLTVCHGCKEDFKREQFNIPEFFEFTTQHQGSLFLIESICVDIDKLLTKKPIGVGCYKVAKRLELSHAIVNGGCFFGVKDEKHTAQVAFTIHSPVQPKNFGTEVKIPFREYPKTMAALESLSKEFSVHDLAQVNNLFKEENQELLPSEETLAVTLVNQIFEKFLLQVYYQKIDNTGMVSVEDLVDIFNARRRTSSAGSQRFNVFRQEASEPRVKADALIQAQGKACYTWNKHNLNKNVLHGNFLCSVKGFSPFQVNKEKIEQDFCGIEVFTADMAYKQFGKLGVDAGDDPVRKDLFVQCGNAKPEPMAGSRWIAKDYTQFAGQPVALLLSEDETKLANTIAMIQNHHEEYVTYNGTCKLFRSTDGKELDGTPPITETPVVDMNESIGKKLLLQAAPYNLTNICSADVDYQNPKVNWEKLKEQGCDIRKGAGSTGGQIHMYMEPQSCIAEESDDGGVVLLCSTQCPIIIQSQIAAMLKVPSAKVVIHVNRLGGGFGGKTVQSWTTAAAAVNASFFYHRQIRIALDRNTDMTITGGRHPFFGIYTVAVQRETERIKALQMNFKIQAGYSQDCSMIVGGFALENAFNCYNWGTYFTDVSAYYTNTVSNTAFRGFGVLQSQFLTESVFEHLVDHITVSDHPDRYKTEVSFSKYESELYQRRFTLRQKNFLKNFDMTPHGTIPLIHVNMEKIWSDAKAIYEDWYKEAIRFNEKSLTKKIGVGITPVMYSVSYDIPRMMQGEASLGIKTDGSVILLVGCVEMGQGINTKIMQIVAQTLRIPFSFIHTAELTTNTPPNSQSTGASTGTDLNGSALVKAAEWAVNAIDQFCHNYWLLLNENPLAPEAAGLFRGQKHFQEIFLRLSTDDSGKYQYPSFWIPTDIATNYRTANSYFESSPSQENKEKKAIADSSYFTAKNEREGMWRSLCAQLEFSRCQLLFCGHSNIEGISAINPETGRGDPAMYQTYAAGISQVEVDMLTGEINFRRAKLIVDAGESLNPAIDIGQIEGAFIQGCGYMTSEEVQYDKSGLNAMNSTWEYKPFFAKSIPKEFIVDMFPTEESKMDDEYINAMDYRKQQRKKVRGSESAGVMSSKSTGEPPVVLSISMFQAIRDAIRAHRDYLYRKFSPNKVPLDALIDFNVAPATTSRIQQAIHKINTVYAETSGNPQSFISLLAEQPIVVGNTSFA